MSAATGMISVKDTQQLDPDAMLMLRVREDDAEAFEELVLRYQARLMSVMENHVHRRDMAEDLVQEVFLRVYRARKRYEPTAKFSTWVYTIANNVASNALRTLGRRKEVHLLGGDAGSTGAPSMEKLAKDASGRMPTRQLDKAEVREVVRMALDSLNERQRMAVLLNKFEHMSYGDIAEAMELSPQAVKSLLARARAVLRDVLSPYLKDGRLGYQFPLASNDESKNADD